MVPIAAGDRARSGGAKLGAQSRSSRPRSAAPRAADGNRSAADFQLAGGPSVLFDAVYVAVSSDGAALLSKEAAAVAWVHDSFSHLKVLGATKAAQPLLSAAGVIADAGVLTDPKPKTYLDKVALGRIYDREPSVRTQF